MKYTANKIEFDSNSPTNQEIKRKLVERDVLHNLSQLFSHLNEENSGDYSEEYSNLHSGSEQDHYDALVENGYHYDIETGEWYADDDKDHEFPLGDDNEEVCDDEGIEPEWEFPEIYEYWAVSDWLGNKLKEQGEAVEDIFDFTVWGRQTTGQAIYMDGIINEIAIALEILDGQPYSWANQD